MSADTLLARARSAWASYARTPVDFPADEGGYAVEVSAGSVLCPPGWVGVVRLGGATIATAPTAALADTLRNALARGDLAGLVATETLGPTTLAFLDPANFRSAATAGVARTTSDDPAVEEFAAANEPESTTDAGIREPAELHVLRDGGRIVAACGYRRWPGEVAHLCILVDREFRGRALARPVAAAAVADALAHGLLPQWRAQVEASRRVARGLGFRELGVQTSLRLDSGTA